jgi:hypothetical protein
MISQRQSRRGERRSGTAWGRCPLKLACVAFVLLLFAGCATRSNQSNQAPAYPPAGAGGYNTRTRDFETKWPFGPGP